MIVVLDSYVIPEKGEFEVHVRRKINLQITAEAAQHKVHSWLLHQVSYMMGAEVPELIIRNENAVWRVPVILTASPVGRVGIVAQIDVNVETGEIDSAAEGKEQILRSAQELIAKLPPYQPRTEMPANYAPITIPPTHKPGRPAGNPLDLLPPNPRSVAL